jgi:molybdenum cofactor cytidylyltransferase
VITGIVLAAGEGRRFGGTKQLADLDGRPLVLHAVGALRAAKVDQVMIVTGHDAEAVEAVLPDDVTVVRNDDYRLGQASSLAAALHRVGDDTEGAVILMADQPGVTSDDIGLLVSRFRGGHARIVRLRYSDGPGPSLLSREIFAEAGHLHGDAGARVLIASHPEWVDEVAVDRISPKDVDRPEDLQTAASRKSE